MRTLLIGRLDFVPDCTICIHAANGKSLLINLDDGEIHIINGHVPRPQGTPDIVIGPVKLEFLGRETPCHTPT